MKIPFAVVAELLLCVGKNSLSPYDEDEPSRGHIENDCCDDCDDGPGLHGIGEGVAGERGHARPMPMNVPRNQQQSLYARDCLLVAPHFFFLALFSSVFYCAA